MRWRCPRNRSRNVRRGLAVWVSLGVLASGVVPTMQWGLAGESPAASHHPGDTPAPVHGNAAGEGSQTVASAAQIGGAMHHSHGSARVESCSGSAAPPSTTHALLTHGMIDSEQQPCDRCAGMHCGAMAGCSSVTPGPVFGAWTTDSGAGPFARNAPAPRVRAASWIAAPPFRPPRESRRA